MNNEILKKISNDKLNVETNEELFDLIKQILSNYAFKYNDILLDFLKDRNLLKIFKFYLFLTISNFYHKMKYGED